MTLQETAKHFRNRLRHEGINAKCKCYTSCGVQWIQVNVPSFDAEFSEEQQRTIRLIAKVNKLTRARGMEIDLEQMTDSKVATFAYGYVS